MVFAIVYFEEGSKKTSPYIDYIENVLHYTWRGQSFSALLKSFCDKSWGIFKKIQELQNADAFSR